MQEEPAGAALRTQRYVVSRSWHDVAFGQCDVKMKFCLRDMIVQLLGREDLPLLSTKIQKLHLKAQLFFDNAQCGHGPPTYLSVIRPATKTKTIPEKTQAALLSQFLQKKSNKEGIFLDSEPPDNFQVPNLLPLNQSLSDKATKIMLPRLTSMWVPSLSNFELPTSLATAGNMRLFSDENLSEKFLVYQLGRVLGRETTAALLQRYPLEGPEKKRGGLRVLLIAVSACKSCNNMNTVVPLCYYLLCCTCLPACF